jgi:hypothetical protein
MSLQVSHEEWVSMWNDYAKNPDKALDWQNRYMNFMFDLEDSSGKIKHNLDSHGGLTRNLLVLRSDYALCVVCPLLFV